MKRFDDLDDQPHDAGRREELAALRAFRAGELAEEVFVDPAEGVIVETGRDLGNFLEQFLQQRAVEDLIGARQHAGELGIVLFDVGHRLVNPLTDVGTFRQVE